MTGRGAAGRDGAEVIRSEEQLQVATRRVPVRRARLERVQITEMITMEVPVIREDVRIVYDTIDQDTHGQDSLDDLALLERPAPRPWVLRGERIVITKEWVPLETVALAIETVTEQQQVTDDVRKERIAVESTPPSAAGVTPAPNNRT